MKNLTPHPFVVRALDGEEIILPPSGTNARVTNRLVPAGTIEIDGHVVPIVERTYGEVRGLTDFGEPCLVSSLTALKVPNRPGVFVPDTGVTAIRGPDGRIVAITRLVKA